MTLETLVLALDYASVLIFALTGALVASRGQLDPVGFIFFATLTGSAAAPCAIWCWGAIRSSGSSAPS